MEMTEWYTTSLYTMEHGPMMDLHSLLQNAMDQLLHALKLKEITVAYSSEELMDYSTTTLYHQEHGLMMHHHLQTIQFLVISNVLSTNHKNTLKLHTEQRKELLLNGMYHMEAGL